MGRVVVRISDLLANSPSNWGRWGGEDEIGSLNFLTPDEALRGIASVRTGTVFTLQLPMADPAGDPVWPGTERVPAVRHNVMDEGFFSSGAATETPGGTRYADDVMTCSLQGSTQYDALGHAWFGSQIWNGFDAAETIGSMTKASVLPIAEHGIVGRGVLVDIARFRGRDCMVASDGVTLDDILGCAASQGLDIQPHDILIVRTGWLAEVKRRPGMLDGTEYEEPGIIYSADLVDWFHRMEIPNLVTDTIGNEKALDKPSGAYFVLHNALMRNLGVLFTEMASLDELAAYCAQEGRYDFLYVAAPLKVVGATGSPVNPIVVM